MTEDLRFSRRSSYEMSKMKLNETPTKENLRFLKSLYRKTFPLSEKKPFSLMVKKQGERKMELMTVEGDCGEFLGLVITILHKDIVLLDYFAIAPDHRGKGIGAQVLRMLNLRYPGKRILLEIEDPREPCKNQEERLRREAFYFRNGFVKQDYKVWLFGVKMLVLTNGQKVSFEEYHEIFDAVFSPKTGKNVTLA